MQLLKPLVALLEAWEFLLEKSRVQETARIAFIRADRLLRRAPAGLQGMTFFYKSYGDSSLASPVHLHLE